MADAGAPNRLCARCVVVEVPTATDMWHSDKL